MKKIYSSLLMVLLLVLAGCQSTQQVVEDTTPPPKPVATLPPEPVETNQVTTVAPPAPPPVIDRGAELRNITTVYFDFDSSEIRSDYRDVVAAHASYMAENPGLRARLEGHADERGSREYNIGLGERRAQSVRRAMSLAGVSGGQLETLSYGEEKPQNLGHSESAWSENRRVQIVYTN